MAEDRDERVRRRAYEIWEREGREPGRERDHWAQAEAEVDGDSAPKKRPSKPKSETTNKAGSKPAKPSKSRTGKPKKG